MMQILQPPGWARAKGFSNGIAASGKLVFIAGQIGWTGAGRVGGDATSPASSARRCKNILDVLAEANGRPEHIVRLTWYVLDKQEYLASLKEVGAAYRELMGKHYPTMAVVQVSGLVEDEARLEIEATAVVPMKVSVIGGGPGGLYFALLAKKAWPRWDITVYERNRPDDTFGFGVVFSDQTLDAFKAYDLVTYERIRRRFAYWGDVDVVYKGKVMRSGGNGFCGCSRVALLNILQDRGRELGVQMRFQREVEGLEEFADSDLIVVADGINSKHPREVQGPLPAQRRPAAQQVHLARLDQAARRLQVLLPRDAGGHHPRALLPVRARPLDLGDRDRRADLAQLRLRQAGRDRDAAGASSACSPRSSTAIR